MINEQNNSKHVLTIGISSTLVLVLFVIFAINHYYEPYDDFSIDVLNTYEHNLYGTGRFSAVPFIDVPIMVLFYSHVLLFCFVKKNKNVWLFIVITSINVIYFWVIGK